MPAIEKNPVTTVQQLSAAKEIRMPIPAALATLAVPEPFGVPICTYYSSVSLSRGTKLPPTGTCIMTILSSRLDIGNNGIHC